MKVGGGGRRVWSWICTGARQSLEIVRRCFVDNRYVELGKTVRASTPSVGGGSRTANASMFFAPVPFKNVIRHGFRFDANDSTTRISSWARVRGETIIEGEFGPLCHTKLDRHESTTKRWDRILPMNFLVLTCTRSLLGVHQYGPGCRRVPS